jgi:predicted small metal-binding protein
MRSLTCQCGHTVRGLDDDDLARQTREHIRMVHPEMQMSDDDVRELINANARDE